MSDIRTERCGSSGFTVIAILILVSLMASLATTFSRHVIVDAQTSQAASTMNESSEVIDSQRDYVLQSHRIGRDIEYVKIEAAIDSGTLGGGHHTEKAQKQMLVDELEEATHTRLFSSIIGDNGLGATRLLETVRVSAVLTSSPAALPTLDPMLAWDLLHDPDIQILEVTTSTTMSGADFEGVIVVSEGAVLTLDDVIVRGAIISASASLGTVPDSYSEFLSPGLLITGMARILSSDAIPGVAIVMPDGRVTAEHPLARVEIRGDVISHSIHLATSGSFEGNMATVVTPVIGAGIDRIGTSRAPRGWSPSLDHHGAWEVQNVAVVPAEISLGDATEIIGFSFPARDAGGGEGSP